MFKKGKRPMARFHFVFSFASLLVIFGGTLFILRKSPLLLCESKRTQIEDTIHVSNTCITDADCTVLSEHCDVSSPCGHPIATVYLGSLRSSIADYSNHCTAALPMDCSQCPHLQVKCVQNACVLQE